MFYTIQLFIAALILLALYQEQDEKLSELESENRKMKLELEEYRSEATHLRNQQATIRRLEDRNRQLEQQVSRMLVLLFFFFFLFIPFFLIDMRDVNFGSYLHISSVCSSFLEILFFSPLAELENI